MRNVGTGVVGTVVIVAVMGVFWMGMHELPVSRQRSIHLVAAVQMRRGEKSPGGERKGERDAKRHDPTTPPRVSRPRHSLPISTTNPALSRIRQIKYEHGPPVWPVANLSRRRLTRPAPATPVTTVSCAWRHGAPSCHAPLGPRRDRRRKGHDQRATR